MFCSRLHVLILVFHFLLLYGSVECQWFRIGMDVLIGNMFLLIEMACKTKRTLTRAELKKVREKNVKRVRRVEEVKRKVERGRKKLRRVGRA